VIADKRVLIAGAAVLLVAGSSTYGYAQTPAETPAAAQPQNAGSANPDRAGLALPTEARSNFARDRNVSVLQRPHEGYQARGLRTGSFLVYPKISATVERNDNIYASDKNEQDDVIWRVTPEIAATSDWSRHSLSAYARAALNRYQDFGTEDTDDYGAGVNGRLDILRGTNVAGGVDYARLTEPRTSPNSPSAALKPVQFDLTSARILGQREFNRQRLSGRYGFQRFEYKSPARRGGGIVDQSFRDRDVNILTGRADYAVSPDTALFFEVSGNKRDYRTRPVGALNRNSDGVQALVGANFELGALTRGEVAVGYIRQKFDDRALRTIDGYGARAQVEWFPTQLTSVTVTGSRTVEDSAAPNAGAYLSSNIGVQVDHELLRNVILTAQAGYGRDEYDVINRRDNRVNASVAATYLLNRTVGVTAAYTYADQDTVRGAGTPFTVNKLSATLTAQF
jgi:hypothetical protein